MLLSLQMTLILLKSHLNHIFRLSNEPTRKVTHIYYGEFLISLTYDKDFDYYLKYKFHETNMDVQEMYVKQEFELEPLYLYVTSD